MLFHYHVVFEISHLLNLHKFLNQIRNYATNYLQCNHYGDSLQMLDGSGTFLSAEELKQRVEQAGKLLH